MSPLIPLSTFIQQSVADLHSRFIRKGEEELKETCGCVYACGRALVWCLWMYNWRSDLCEHITLCCCLQYARPKRWRTLSSSLLAQLTLVALSILNLSSPARSTVLYKNIWLSLSLYHILHLLSSRRSFKGSNPVNYLITSVSSIY